jgi:hypothetical protein
MMKSKAFLALTLISAATAPLSARGPHRDEQDQAASATQNGAVLPLRTIENSIVPDMKASGADYIGQEFDGAANRYRLKFMRGRSVIWVDVDGRTGAVIGRAGG